MKIAIVGGGPRALWAVEELWQRARQHGSSLEVVIFGETLSAPSAFHVHQPKQWLVNGRTSAIETSLGAFDDWRTSTDDYPPRQEVAEFLQDSWRNVMDNVPSGCRLRRIEKRVTVLEPAGSGWEVEAEVFDEVLLVTGHEHSWPGSLDPQDFSVPVISLDDFHADLTPITKDDRVLVRGAALTFIDVVRAVPAKLFPVTRSGRFLQVKADYKGEFPEVTEKFLLASSTDEIRDALVEAASALAGRDAHAALEEDEYADPIAELRASYRGAIGDGPLTPAVALGIVYGKTYGALIDRVSFGGRDSLPGIGDLTKRMHRVAFGPPPESAKTLLDAIDSGRVDTTFFASGDQPLHTLDASATYVIDSVQAPAGVIEGSLIDALIQRGHAHIYPGTNALWVQRDATVYGNKHLAAAGRMTEGYVLGNDTLARDRHDLIPRWADRIIAAT